MKQDLKINYGILEELVSELYRFMRAIEEMQSAIQSLNTMLSDASGETIEAIKSEKEIIEKHLMTYKEQISDVYILVSDYINEMTDHIEPISMNAFMRVDRNDIWWNLNSMKTEINDLTLVTSVNRVPSIEPTSKMREDNVYERNFNINKVGEMEDSVRSLKTSLHDKLDELNCLFDEKIVKYEETDDTYKKRAKSIYDKYTTFWEGVQNNLGIVGNGVKNFVDGFLEKGGEIFWNTLHAIGGLFEWGLTGIVVGIYNLCGAEVPDFLQTSLDNYNAQFQTIWNDPFLLIEGMAQSWSDDFDERGVFYVTGGALGEVFVLGQMGGYVSGEFSKISEGFQALKGLSVAEQIALLEKHGIQVIDGKVNGTIPLEEYIDAWLNSVYNVNADYGTLGKFSIPGTPSYIDVAKESGSSYFDMGDEGWNHFVDTYGLTSREMFDLFNKPYLDNIIASKKPMYFSHNPLDHMDSALGWEYVYLDNAGYVYDELTGWMVPTL